MIDRNEKEWVVFNDCRVSVLQDKESSGGWLHKTVRVWNATVETVAFMLCTFCHNFKILNLERSCRPMDMGGHEASPRTHVQWQRWWSIGKLHFIPKPYVSPVLLYCSSSLLSFHLYLTFIFYLACYLRVFRWKQNTKRLQEGETRVREVSVRPIPQRCFEPSVKRPKPMSRKVIGCRGGTINAVFLNDLVKPPYKCLCL